MLSPKKTKYRKQMKMVRHLMGVEKRGTKLAFGDFGLMALESGWVTARQIEAARIAIARYVKRGGKIWIKIFPDKPLTKKPAETRMGSGKGAPEEWVAEVRAGRIMYELAGISADQARECFKRAGSKLPLKSRLVARSQYIA